MEILEAEMRLIELLKNSNLSILEQLAVLVAVKDDEEAQMEAAEIVENWDDGEAKLSLDRILLELGIEL